MASLEISKWEDIDFKAKVVTMRRQLVLLRGKAVLKDRPKTEAGERTVPLPEEVVEILRFHKRRQDNEKDLCGEAYEDTALSSVRPMAG